LSLERIIYVAICACRQSYKQVYRLRLGWASGIYS